MNAIDLQTYKSNLIRSRDSEIEAVNEKYNRALTAVAILLEYAMAENKPDLTEATVAEINSKIQNVRQAVYEAVKNSTGTFSSVTLAEFIQKNYPNILIETPSFLSAALWRMKQDGLIEVVTKGAGRTPSLYKKASNFGAVK
jgi:hypothetical protein